MQDIFSVDPSDVSFLPSDSEIIKLGIGKKFLTTFHMSRNVSKAIRERFSFVQLAIFDRDMVSANRYFYSFHNDVSSQFALILDRYLLVASLYKSASNHPREIPTGFLSVDWSNRF